MRIVLYAEGSGEAAGTLTLPPAPGELLSEEEVGAGHVLVRRCVASKRGLPESAVQFVGPLRLRGVVARGSALRTRQALRQLLTGAFSSRRPDLAVVLVDSERENDAGLRQKLHSFLEDIPLEHVVGAARPEFEAWLIADCACVAKVLGVGGLPTPPDPESLGPSAAKELWSRWLGEHLSGSDHDRKTRQKAVRLEVAARCDLQHVAARCPSFAAFWSAFAPRA